MVRHPKLDELSFEELARLADRWLDDAIRLELAREGAVATRKQRPKLRLIQGGIK